MIFMGCALGGLNFICYYFLIYFEQEEIYFKMENNFSILYSYLYTITIAIAILLNPLLKKIRNIATFKNILSKRLLTIIGFLLILGILEGSSRHLFNGIENLDISIKQKFRNYSYFTWTIFASMEIMITLLLILLTKVILKLRLDLNARYIYKRIKTKKIENFTLYLRSFDIDNKMIFDKIENDRHIVDHLNDLGPFSNKIILKEYSYNLESKLASITKKVSPLIALGGFNLGGAGKIKTKDESWKETFKSLARNANFIYIIPAINKGTFYEMEWIFKQKLLSKTFFLLPPLKEYIYDKMRWDAIKSKCYSINIFLPDYEKDGLIFQLNENGKIKGAVPFVIMETYLKTMTASFQK